MKIRTQNKWKRIVEIPFNETIKYLVNEEEAILCIAPLENDIEISINTNFSYFGDSLKIYLESSNPEEYRRVRFISGVNSPDYSICSPVFLEFRFSGKEYLPVSGSSSEIKIGSIINESEIGCLLYTDRSNLLKQDKDSLYWNDKKKFLGVGNDSPESNIDVVGPKSQIKISSNSPREVNSSIEFGRYGEESSFVLGQFGSDFCLKDLKTGEIYQLNNKIEKENGKNQVGTGNKPGSKRAGK